MIDWQPIDTAPDEQGKTILISDGYIVATAKMVPPHSGVWVCAWHHEPLDEIMEATHWAEVQKPPKDE